MLPSSRRVSRPLFASVLKSSKSFHSSHFSLRMGILSDIKELSRISVVVSSQVCKKAHDRNLLKRRVRGAVEQTLGSIKPGVALVFFAKKSAKELDFKGITSETELLLSKAGAVLR